MYIITIVLVAAGCSVFFKADSFHIYYSLMWAKRESYCSNPYFTCNSKLNLDFTWTILDSVSNHVKIGTNGKQFLLDFNKAYVLPDNII